MSGSRQKWEESDFPILCESCLGPNPYVRMLKDKFGLECKICSRPYTVFKWSPSAGERWSKTEICQTCAKIKNCCQTCILDLEFKIHTKDRDEILQVHNNIPVTDVNSQVFIRQLEDKMDGNLFNHGKAQQAAKEVLKRLAEKKKVGKKKERKCMFYMKGDCKRGLDCPFVHSTNVILEKTIKKDKELKDFVK